MLSITDVKIIQGEGVAADPGWEKCLVDLNEAAGGEWLYLALRRDPERQVPGEVVTGIDIMTGDGTVPEGWDQDPVDLNLGTSKHNTSLYLLVQRGGPQEALVGIQVIRDKDRPPRGYEVLATDLNTGAGGSDLFLAYLRQQRTLTIRRLGCISPSSGYGSLAEKIVNIGYNALIEAALAVATRGRSLEHAATTAAKAAAKTAATAAAEEGLKAAAASAVGSEEVADAGVDAVNAALTLREALKGSGGETIAMFNPLDTGFFADLLTDGTSAVAIHVGQNLDDDVYLRIDDAKVWPFTKHGEYDMRSKAVVDVNFVTPFDKPITIRVVDKDYPLWLIDTETVAHDVLGEGTFTPGVSRSQVCLFYNTDEGSAYLAEILIDEEPGQEHAASSLDLDAAVAAATQTG